MARIGMIALALIVSVILLYFAQRDDLVTTEKNAAHREEIIISYVLPGFSGYEQSLIKEGANTAAREWNVSVLFEAAESQIDVNKQAEAIRQAIRNQVDAIVLLPGNYDALRGDVQRAASAGIPVIIANNDVADDPVVCSIFTDSGKAAADLGKEIRKRFLEGGDYVLLLSNAAVDRNQSRRQGVEELLAADARFIRIQEAFDPQENVNEARQFVEEAIAKRETLDFIVALDGISAQGAAQALRQAESDILLFTYDCIPAVINAVDDGVVSGMIMENSFSVGYLSVVNAMKAIQGEQIPAQIQVEYRLITPENLYDSENVKLVFPFNK